LQASHRKTLSFLDSFGEIARDLFLQARHLPAISAIDRLWFSHFPRALHLNAIRTYHDRDVALVWTLEHLSKTNWQRSSSVQIKPPQPKFLVFHSVLILSTLLVVKGYRIEFSV